MTSNAEKGTMLTAAKAAKELGVPVGQIKKAIAALKIKPDQVKGGCSYYSADTVKKIKSGMK